MRHLLNSLAAMFLLGCGDASGQDLANDSAQALAPSPDVLPEGFSLPPATSIASSSQVSTPGGEGTFFYLETEATAQAIESHFMAQAEAAGFALRISENQHGFRQIHGERADGLQFDFAASTYEDGSTRASLAVGRPTTN